MASDVVIFRANRRILDITVQDPPGTPIDVTGWTATFAFRTNIIGAPNLGVLSSEGTEPQIQVGIDDTSLPTPIASRVWVTLIETDTDRAPGWYVWDCLMRDPSTGWYTVVKGALRIVDDLQRPSP